MSQESKAVFTVKIKLTNWTIFRISLLIVQHYLETSLTVTIKLFISETRLLIKGYKTLIKGKEQKKDEMNKNKDERA